MKKVEPSVGFDSSDRGLEGLDAADCLEAVCCANMKSVAIDTGNVGSV